MSQTVIIYNNAPEPKTRAALKGLELKVSQYPPLLEFIDTIDPEHEDTIMIHELLITYEEHLKRVSATSKAEHKVNRKKDTQIEVSLFGEKELTKSGQEKVEKRANGGKVAIDRAEARIRS